MTGERFATELAEVLYDSDPGCYVDEARLAAWAAKLRAAALAELDLNDPETENAVAAAIARFTSGGFIPLSERYPWRFPQVPPGRCGAEHPAVAGTSCDLLAGHAGQHEAVVWPEASPENLGLILVPSRAHWSDAAPP